MALDVKVGARLRSSVCTVHVVVVQAGGGSVDLRCGGHPMVPIDQEPPAGLTPVPGFDGGTVMGKRYADEAGAIELLCSKAGPSSLSVGDVVLEMKRPKPLPSAD